MKKPLDAWTARACARRMRVRAVEAKGNDERRIDRESSYWLGAADAFRAARVQLETLARTLERKTKAGKR